VSLKPTSTRRSSLRKASEVDHYHYHIIIIIIIISSSSSSSSKSSYPITN